MQKRLSLSALLLFLAFCLTGIQPQPAFSSATPAEGGIFPDLMLPLPNRVEEREYLAVEEGPFLLSQIKADVVVLEIFNMYCPHCQKDAPNVNGLYQAVLSRPDLKSKIKVIGVGAGNTPFEINAYKNLYRVQFPLLPDGNYAVHKAVGEVGTPYYFVLQKKAGGWQVVYSRAGSFGDPWAFLQTIAAKTGIGKKK